jgi:hypothetical protein
MAVSERSEAKAYLRQPEFEQENSTLSGHRSIVLQRQLPMWSRDGLFPDPTLRWRPHASKIDGIDRPPFVFDQGFWRGVLHLIVVAPNPSIRAYGIEIPCEIYAGFEEMIYSVANHGAKASHYDGGVYIKEAENSALLKAYTAADPLGRKPRHFLFVGSDRCYEVLGFSEPIIRAFNNPDEAYAWGPPK